MTFNIKKVHTRVLLQWLNVARSSGLSKYDSIRINYHYRQDRRPIFLCFSYDEIKTELSTREHIPNKKEARKIRQEKAKRK